MTNNTKKKKSDPLDLKWTCLSRPWSKYKHWVCVLQLRVGSVQRGNVYKNGPVWECRSYTLGLHSKSYRTLAAAKRAVEDDINKEFKLLDSARRSR